MKKLIENLKRKWLIDTSKTAILILILFAIFIGINVLVQKLDIQDIDVTKNKLFTLSEASINQAKAVNEEIKIYLIGFGEGNSLEDIVKQYTKQNSKITYELIEDIQDRVDLKSKYGITDETQVIILESKSKNKILTIDDLYTYDYTNYTQIDVTEEKITNAIVDLSIVEKTKLYFLMGHNEYGINTDMTMLKAYLENEVNEIETLDLLVTGKIPEDIKLLVIASPQKDLLDTELEIITNYINNGGKILWLNDPTFTGKSLPNFEKLSGLFGAKFEDGIILEQDASKMALQSPNYIIPNIASTKATEDIATDGGILLINASKIIIEDEEILNELNISKEEILTTGDTALFRKDATNTSTSKISSDEQGSFTIGVKLTKTIEDKEAILYMLSNNFFTVDYPITIGSSQTYPIMFYNNKDYILNTIAELTNREDTISIRKDTGIITYTATEAQDRIIKVVISVFPALIIIVGIAIWIIRRRKK